MIVQVRMPPRLVQLLDRMAKEGLYASRSEAILDSVRRLVIGYERSDRFRRTLIRSYLGKKGLGSVDDLARELDPAEIASAIRKVFNTDSIDEIISEVRR
jgi:Arc/MetJ-type ribon-helix-helix transcriptional regulator